MTHDLVWADLSAYRPDAAKRFYSDLLGWGWSGDDYDLAMLGEAAVAAIYQMPSMFMDMEMPSFWMSYIAVVDVPATVAIARDQGGIIELEAEDHALIRDPLGAGFTVHSALGDTTPKTTLPGYRHGHGYFCADLGAVAPFYATLFGWQFTAIGHGQSEVLSAGRSIATAMELPDEVRGKEQYWAVCFSVRDLAAAEQSARQAGATDVLATQLPEGPARLVFDPDGAAFFMVAP